MIKFLSPLIDTLYIYIYIYTHIYIIYIYINIYILHICICIYIYMFMYIFYIYICICIYIVLLLLSTDWSYISLLYVVKLSTLLIKKGSHKRYATLTGLAVVWALWSFKIFFWSELYWSALKERNNCCLYKYIYIYIYIYVYIYMYVYMYIYLYAYI